MPLVATIEPSSVIERALHAGRLLEEGEPGLGPQEERGGREAAGAERGAGDDGRRGDAARRPARRRVQDVVVPHAVAHEAALVVARGRDPRVAEDADREAERFSRRGSRTPTDHGPSVAAAADRPDVAGEVDDGGADAPRRGGPSPRGRRRTPSRRRRGRSPSPLSGGRRCRRGRETAPASTKGRSAVDLVARRDPPALEVPGASGGRRRSGRSGRPSCARQSSAGARAARSPRRRRPACGPAFRLISETTLVSR